MASISDLLDFRKFNCPPASVLQNFAVTEVYVKRAQKCLGKDMRANWTTELDIETLESRRSWATLSEVQSRTPFSFLSYTCGRHLCHPIHSCLLVPKSKRLSPNDIPASNFGHWQIHSPHSIQTNHRNAKCRVSPTKGTEMDIRRPKA